MSINELDQLQLPRELESRLEKAIQAVDELETVHEPTVTASASTSSPGKTPSPTVIGDSIIGLGMTVDTDDALRTVKIPGRYLENTAALHIHWTKSTNTDDSNKTVRWRVTYTVFDGSTDDVVGTSQVVEYEDSYLDSGTTNRVIYRTPNLALDGSILPRYYVGLKIEAITPSAGTPLTEPVLVNLDITYRKYVHDL